MFNIGPLEIMVLAIVGLVVLGPDRLPDFIRDAARLLRSLRDMATGARQQLRDELGPEFADIDLRNLNPRTAVTRAVFGDDAPDLQKYNPRNFDARSRARDFMNGDDPTDGTAAAADAADAPVSMSKQPPSANGSAGPADSAGSSGSASSPPRPPSATGSGSCAGAVPVRAGSTARRVGRHHLSGSPRLDGPTRV